MPFKIDPIKSKNREEPFSPHRLAHSISCILDNHAEFCGDRSTQKSKEIPPLPGAPGATQPGPDGKSPKKGTSKSGGGSGKSSPTGTGAGSKGKPSTNEF